MNNFLPKFKIKILLLVFCLFFGSIVNAQSNQQQIVIKTRNSALVFQVNSKKQLSQTYFGASLTDDNDYKQIKPNSGDAFVTGGGTYNREPALQVSHSDGNASLQLTFLNYSTDKVDENISVTHIAMQDTVYPVIVTWHIKCFAKEDVLEQWTTIENKAKTPLVLNSYASACLQFSSEKYYLTHFYGEWANEMRLEEILLPEGIKTIESKLGVRATNSDNPSFMLALNNPASEETGEVVAGTLAWSGNFRILFENILNNRGMGNRLQLIAGINPYASDYTLKSGQAFTTPSFILTYSNTGKGQASRNLHHWALNYGIYNGKVQRQTLLNNWEATYFDFNEQKLTGLLDDTKKLGVDVFLLDDGWFANKYPRDNAKAGLGDWDENKTKLPNGIGYLVKEANQKGVKFGIWVESEMVNPKSELYEKHPDWILKLPNRPEHLQRDQLVLDLTNPQVQEHAFSVVDNLLSKNPEIAYIKWDCNRTMTNAYSPYLKANQPQMYVDYTLGLYKVLERMRAKYPAIEMMWCSGGGGRAEYGGLKYFQEFWPSDNTDPFDRIFIQWGYSYFFPSAVQCAHVTSMGKQSIKFKTDVAMMGKLGYDIQISHFTSEELKFSQQAIQNYQRLQPIINLGDLYRLQDPYSKEKAALQYVNEDRTHAVLFVFALSTLNGDVFPPILLKGLDPTKKYLIKEINLMDETKPQSKQSGSTFSGDYLMKIGLTPYLNKVLTSSVIEITQL